MPHRQRIESIVGSIKLADLQAQQCSGAMGLTRLVRRAGSRTDRENYIVCDEVGCPGLQTQMVYSAGQSHRLARLAPTNMYDSMS